MLDLLEENLPQIPGKPKQVQINPPDPKKKDQVIRVEYGKLMPVKDEDGKKKKN